jgi:hypothetical protein
MEEIRYAFRTVVGNLFKSGHLRNRDGRVIVRLISRK